MLFVPRGGGVGFKRRMLFVRNVVGVSVVVLKIVFITVRRGRVRSCGNVVFIFRKFRHARKPRRTLIERAMAVITVVISIATMIIDIDIVVVIARVISLFHIPSTVIHDILTAAVANVHFTSQAHLELAGQHWVRSFGNNALPLQFLLLIHLYFLYALGGVFSIIIPHPNLLNVVERFALSRA